MVDMGKEYTSHVIARLRARFRADPWLYIGMVALLLVSALIVGAFYANHPSPETDPDTPGYLVSAHNIAAHGSFVSPSRLPGFPTFVALMFAVAGQGNLQAVSVATGVLFVISTLEIYIIVYLITRRAWIAFVIGLIMTSNVWLLTWIKPVIVEGFALWVTVTLALAVLLFLRRPSARLLWIVAAVTLLLFMTRPEWVYAPVPLFAYLLIVAWRKGHFRTLVKHAALAVVALYLILGAYVTVNAVGNGYRGVSEVQNLNLFGKILEYQMQDEAPPEYADLTREVDAYVAAGNTLPNGFLYHHQDLVADHYQRLGAYSTAIIVRHPVEFVAKTVPLYIDMANAYRYWSHIDHSGRFAKYLLLLQPFSTGVHATYWLFSLVGILWLALFFWRPTSRRDDVAAMSGLALLAFYEMALVALGSYGLADMARIQVPIDPILLVIVWVTLLSVFAQIVPSRASSAGESADKSARSGADLIAGAVTFSSPVAASDSISDIETMPVPALPKSLPLGASSSATSGASSSGRLASGTAAPGGTGGPGARTWLEDGRGANPAYPTVNDPSARWPTAGGFASAPSRPNTPDGPDNP